MDHALIRPLSPILSALFALFAPRPARPEWDAPAHWIKRA